MLGIPAPTVVKRTSAMLIKVPKLTIQRRDKDVAAAAAAAAAATDNFVQ